MKTSIKPQKLLTLPTLLVSCMALAGPISSGGGNAVVCRSESGVIQSAELLDLFEAKQRYSLDVMTASGIFEQDYVRGVRNTYSLQGGDDIMLGSETRENLDRFMNITRFTRPGEKLPLLNDRGRHSSAPAGCQIEQLAIFKVFEAQGLRETEVKIDSEIWDALDSLNQAALVSHELYYMYERDLAEKTSETTRALVGHIYTASGLEPVETGVPADARKCVTKPKSQTGEQKVSVFDLYFGSKKNANGVEERGTILQFKHVMGRPVVAKSTVFLRNLAPTYTDLGRNFELIDLNTGKIVDLHTVLPIDGAHRKDWSLEVTQDARGKVKIGLVQGGLLLEEERVEICFNPRN